MRFVKDNNGIFRHLFRDLVSDFWIEQIVEGVDDDVGVRQLVPTGSMQSRQILEGSAHHSTNSKVRTDAMLDAVRFDFIKSVDTFAQECSRLKFA